MRIAIISDIHENFHNLILALSDMNGQSIDRILCLGDLMNSGIAKVLAIQEVPVYMIWGNNDGEKVDITVASKEEGSSLTVSNNTYDFITIDNRKIFITHYNDLAVPMAHSGLYDAVFYGHDHLKNIEKINDCWVVNPGELAASKTGIASYAIYDTASNSIEIITVENAISTRTDTVDKFFKQYGHKMKLRSKKAFGL